MDIVFPVMPFADAGRPSMGVSLLSAHARRAGYSTSVVYYNLQLAERMGLALYQQIANAFAPNFLVGEWFFADSVFGDEIPPAEDFLREIFLNQCSSDLSLVEQLQQMRLQREEYLDGCVESILRMQPAIVGFTTTFHQTCACLAVAKKLKALPRPPIILFGGANCEGEMGLQMIRSFEWIDYICCGESDTSFLKLLGQLLRGQPRETIPGVLERGKADAVVRSEAVSDMDGLPYPEFDGYFDNLASSQLAGQFEPHLVFETSRGCWWGAKHHCTFCGLNGDTMAFRSKHPDRAFVEIEYLASRYQSKRIGCVDNILDMRYVNTLFPRLAERGFDLEIFYEVKANLRYDQLKKMRDGGLKQIQPGIESFSNQILKLMNKGCTGLQNIQLLRWCEELQIEPSWNILSGFPGESPDEYELTARLLPLLTHLAPPCSCGMIRLDRFSPFHSNAEQYGFERVRPARAYYYVFPLGRQALNRLAYFFDFDYADQRDPRSYILPVQQEVQRWLSLRHHREDAPPRLDANFDDGGVVIDDTRPIAVAARHEFTGTLSRILARCDVAASHKVLAESLDITTKELQDALKELRVRHLIVESDGMVVSLPVFRNRPLPSDLESRIKTHVPIPEAVIAKPLLPVV